MALPSWTLQQAIDQLNSGDAWSGSKITYAFPLSKSGLYTGGGEGAGFASLNTVQQERAQLALQLWDDLIAPDFAKVAAGLTYTSADLEFGMSATGVSYAHAWYPDIGSVWFNSESKDLLTPQIGDDGFVTFVHEIGHALGLNHMGDYNGSANAPSSYQDSTVFTIMSYFGPSWGTGQANGEGQVAWADWVGSDGRLDSPQTPMLYDVMAIQAMYGLESTTRTENTTYGFNSTITGSLASIYNFAVNKHPILTIYDSGGADTLDLSGWSSSSVINLAAGAFSSCNQMTNNIAIAYSCEIENAFGGGGDDVIHGNALANYLKGGSGGDKLFGYAGADHLYGGAGNDVIDAGDGVDYAYFDAQWSAMAIAYDAIKVTFTFTSALGGVDTVTGAEFFVDAANVVRSAADWLNTRTGAAGADALVGGAANETFYGLAGDDTLRGNGGDDQIDGGAGLDMALFSGSRSGYSIVAGETIKVVDQVAGRDGADTLSNVERLGFADEIIAFDLTGAAGQGYRIYQAAFDRTPDQGGLSYWVGRLDGGATLKSLAEAFLTSAEFQALYGSNATNKDFVDAMYQNVLDRAPDQAGLDYWSGVMSAGMDRADILVQFSESSENQANVSAQIQGGIHLDWPLV